MTRAADVHGAWVAASSGMFAPETDAARSILELTWLMTVLGTVVFLAFLAFLGLALKRRAASLPEGAPPGDPQDEVRGRRWLVTYGVAIPLVVLIVVFGATLRSMVAISQPAEPEAMTVEIIGHQWWYEVNYPGTGISLVDELHLPAGRATELEVTSADVIHSFWVPALGGKIDLLPDRVNRMVLRPEATGTHRMHCAEFCGLNHTDMKMTVVVESEEDFQAWLASQEPTDVRPTPTAASPTPGPDEVEEDPS